MKLTFDGIASQFDHQRGLPREAVVSWLHVIDELAAGKALRIFEPGIGTGRIALPLAAMGHRVSGTDISQHMLNACMDTANSMNIRHQIELSIGDATDLSYSDHIFDLGIIAQLLYLVPDWTTVLDELARVVRPGGHVIHLTEPTTESDALAMWSGKWREVIESTGYRHFPLSPTDADVVAEFHRRWPDTEILEMASWGFGQTVSEAMENYAVRIRPLYQTVPEEAFLDAVAEFLTWAKKEFPDTNTSLDGSITLTAMIAST